jgi:hemoglobin
MTGDRKSTLYDRLGGLTGVAAVVDDLIDRIVADERLNRNPAIADAHRRVSVPAFRYLVTEMICWAAGGPQHYTGRSMADSHRDLEITGADWDAFVEDTRASLDHFEVPRAEQDELLAVVASTRGDIVTA